MTLKRVRIRGGHILKRLICDKVLDDFFCEIFLYFNEDFHFCFR